MLLQLAVTVIGTKLARPCACLSVVYLEENILFLQLLPLNFTERREAQKPVIYLLARCPIDNSPLVYSNTRMENMIHLSNSITGKYCINI